METPVQDFSSLGMSWVESVSRTRVDEESDKYGRMSFMSSSILSQFLFLPFSPS